MAKTLYILDASSYVFRAYHAVSFLSNSKGFPTNAIYGFINMINKFISEVSPEYFVAVFDSGGKSFRNDIYPEYKANRGDAPEDISLQFPKIIEYLKLRGIKVMSLENYEADDIIGSISEKYNKKIKIVIISGDKDFTQLISRNVSMLDTMKNKIIDNKEVETKYGLKPGQMIDYFSLVGDSVDNIPGVKGIGPKTAQILISEFKNLDSLYKNIKKVNKERIKNLLIDSKDDAYLSKELITIEKNIKLEDKIEDFVILDEKINELNDFFSDLEFDSMIKESEEAPKKILKINHKIIQSVEEFDVFLRTLKKYDEISLDLETTSLNPMDADIVGISFTFEEEKSYYIPLQHSEDSPQLEIDFVIKKLKKYLESDKVKKIGQNLKYEILVFEKYNIHLGGIFFDTMVAAHYLDSSLQSYSLDNLSRRFLDHKMISFKEITTINKKKINFKDVPILDAAEYSCEDSFITYKLYKILSNLINTENNMNIFIKNEMPFVQVLAALENRGVYIDTGKLNTISKKFEKLIVNIEKNIYKMIGKEININSTLQLRDILFNELNLKPFKKTKKGEFSTDSESLQSMSSQHKVIEEILSFRFYSKLKSTYLDSLPVLISKTSNRIHTSYNQTGTSTGRLSSSNPNLQNIPIKSSEGKQIRESFVSQDKKSIIISADYSQIELRLLAHFSKDETMIKSYTNNEDIHKNTASEIFNVSNNMITEDQRRLAKTINFGIIYGIGPKRLALQINSDNKTAKDYIEKYFEKYPNVQTFFQESINISREKGYAETILNRRRYLKDITSKNYLVRSASERAAINTPIQGSAADIIKLAMIDLHNDKFIVNNSKLIIQVHDELVFECNESVYDELKVKIKNHMENCYKLKVPLKVDINKGQSWSDAH